MIRKNQKTLILLGIELLILIICILFSKFRSMNVYEIDLTQQGNPTLGVRSEGEWIVTPDMISEEEKGKKIDINMGLNTAIKKGSYQITIFYDTAGSENYLHLSTSELAYALDSETISLPIGGVSKSADIVFHSDVTDFNISLEYDSNEYLAIQRIVLEENRSRDGIWIFRLFLLMLFVNFCLYIREKNKNGKIDRKKVQICFILLGITVVASIPLLTNPGFFWGHDFSFHLHRIEGIADGLLDGQFPVKIHPETVEGYGYANSYFYPELFLYIPAILRLIGYPLLSTYKIFLFLINLATAFLAYYSFKKMYRNTTGALLGSMLYTLSLYRLTNEYTRAALGEALAMVFFPLVIYGFYRILMDSTDGENYKKSWIVVTLGLTGVAQTHILSVEIVAVFVLITCIVCIKRVFEKSRFMELLKALIACIYFNCWFYIPMLLMTRTDDFRVFTKESENLQGEALQLSQMFQLFPASVGLSQDISNGLGEEMPLGVGIVLFLGLLAFVFCLVVVYKKKEVWDTNRELIRTTSVFGAFGIVALWIASYYFPWEKMYQMNERVSKIVSSIQFPWRFLGIGTVFLICVLCGTWILLRQENKKWGEWMFCGVVVLSLVSALFLMDEFTQKASFQYAYTIEGYQWSYGTAGGEYLPDGFSYDTVSVKKATCTDEKVTISDYFKKGTHITAYVENPTDHQVEVSMPLIYYYGYQAENQTNHQSLTVVETDRKTVAVLIPAGSSMQIAVSYQEPMGYHMLEIITLISILLITFFIRKKRKQCHNFKKRL